MERVQFQQEQMLPELKDLLEKGIFSQTEIKQIMKKRTAFETALVRRVARKADFLRYAAYEMNLEALRKKRVARLNIPRSARSISDYALVRRQFHIFERALKKFKSDIGLWIQYLQIAKREGARALLGRISARALQLHPNSPALYILAASHELKHLSPSAARALLQRGIRLNPESVDLWREYVTMELRFVESLRRRWKILGLTESDDGNTQQSKEGEALVTEALEENGREETDIDIDIDMDGTTSDHDVGEEARREILQGALIKTAISSAVKAIPKISLFKSLHDLLKTYPCAQSLRHVLLDHLHEHLQSFPSFSVDPQVVHLHATRYLTPDLTGVELVDMLRQANETLLSALRHGLTDELFAERNSSSPADDMAKTYILFAKEWLNKDIDENLKLYILSSLQSLASLTPPLPSLLVAHLELLHRYSNPSPSLAPKILKLAKKYTSRAPNSSELWLARLKFEDLYSDGSSWHKVWEEGRKSIGKNEADSGSVEHVWLWGLKKIDESNVESQYIYEKLLREAMHETTMRSLHEKLLIRYINFLHHRRLQQYHNSVKFYEESGKDIKMICKDYLPTAVVWENAFKIHAKLRPSILSSTAEDMQTLCYRLLHQIYEIWRGISTESHRDAAIAFGLWLLRSGKGMGKEATAVIERARLASASSAEDLAAFESRWRSVVDNDDNDESLEELDAETDYLQ